MKSREQSSIILQRLQKSPFSSGRSSLYHQSIKLENDVLFLEHVELKVKDYSAVISAVDWYKSYSI